MTTTPTVRGERQLYSGSYALLIGNSAYTTWNSLPGVARDIPQVEAVLRDKHGFIVEKALNLTRNELRDRVDEFISKYGQNSENRLVIYYAGHGYTLKLDATRNMGYLVMKDAPAMPPVAQAMQETPSNIAEFYLKAISMDEVNLWARAIRSKHALLIFDSCFSGTVLYRDSVTVPSKEITEETMKPMRGFLTAGDERQTVRDDSPFRRALVTGLEGAADSNGDGLIFVTELAEFVKSEVLKETRDSANPQSPIFDRQENFRRGDMVFLSPRGDRRLPEALKAERFASNPVWSMPTLMSGDWETVDANQSIRLAGSLKAVAAKEWTNIVDRIVKFRRMKLSFYPDAYLYEALIQGPAFESNGTLDFVVANGGKDAAILNGTSSPIHSLNDVLTLQLDSDQKAEDYLRFFMSAVNGKDGDFHVVESGGQIAWEEDVRADNRSLVEKWVKPLSLIEKPDAKTWKYEMTVQYRDALFWATLEVKATGMVDMLDDEPISTDLPLKAYMSSPQRHLKSKWLPQLARGDWSPLNPTDSAAMHEKLMRQFASSENADAINQVETFRKTSLSFYPGAILYEGSIPATRFAAPGSFTFVTLQDGSIILLNGKASALTNLNLKAPLRLDTKEKVIEYLRFAGAAVDEGGYGFYIAASGDELPWLENVAKNEKRRLSGLFEVPVVERDQDGNWSVSVTIARPAGLNQTKIEIDKAGSVKFIGTKALSEKLELRWLRFSGPVRSDSDRHGYIGINIREVNAEFLTERGYDLAKELNYDLAIELYARAIQSSPIYAGVYQRRAEAQLALKRFDLALTDVARALELDDSDAETWLTKGRILQKKGDTAGAKEAVQKAIGLDPKNEAAKHMLEEISKEK